MEHVADGGGLPGWIAGAMGEGRDKGMMDKSLEKQLALLLESEPLLQSCGRLFAHSFALYTVEVMRLLRPAALDMRPPVPGPVPSIPEVPSGIPVPPWIQQELEKVRAGQTRSEPSEPVRARVARNKLLLALREKNITQAELAKMLGKSTASISRMLRNPEQCKIKTLKDVAAKIGVDLSDILP